MKSLCRTMRAVCVALGLAAALSACATQAAETSAAPSKEPSFVRADSHRLVAKSSIVSFPVSDGEQSWHTAGILNVPYGAEGPRPAVLIVHGSGGIDSRGALYAEALNRAGFVTLEIDLWAPRGVRGPAGRPRTVMETLPDAFAALAFLSAQSLDVDAARVGVTGFSWGGVVSMLTAVEAQRARYAQNGQAFAAHAPIYPVCWVYNRVPGYDFRELTGAPVFIQGGEADTYDAPDSCLSLQQSLPEPALDAVTVRMHPGATHAFERREPGASYNDPYSHLGAGGEVEFRYNETAARDSVRAVVAFFTEAL